MCLEIICLIYGKKDLALNVLQWLIYIVRYAIKPKQTKSYVFNIYIEKDLELDDLEW